MKVLRTDLFSIPLALVTVEEGFNARKDMGDIPALAESIMEVGQVLPATVTKVRGKEEYILTDGHRRLAAIQYANEKLGANIETLKAQKGEADIQSRTITMMIAGESKKLTDAEKLAGFNRLVEFGMKPQEIAKVTGVSPAGVYNTLQVNKAPEAVKQMVEEGLISIPAVNEITRTTKDPVEQEKLVKEAVKNAQNGDAPKNGKAKKATSSNVKKEKKANPIIAKLEEAISLADDKSPKAAVLKTIVNKLKAGGSAEDIAKLLK